MFNLDMQAKPSESDIGFDTRVLPPTTIRLNFREREFFLLGTAHVSDSSVNDVRNLMEQIHPDTVCVELCNARYQSMKYGEDSEKPKFWASLRQGALLHYFISTFYHKLGRRLEIRPGAEMTEALRLAEEIDAEIVLADQDVDVTMSRLRSNLTFWDKVRLALYLLQNSIFTSKIDKELVESMKNKDKITEMMDSFCQSFPKIKKVLIDERDFYLAGRILSAPGEVVLAVLGIGHLEGVKCEMERRLEASDWATTKFYSFD